MDITYKKSNGLILNNKTVKLLISNKDKYKGDDFDLVIAQEYEGDGFSINSPGEYEISGVSVLAQSSKGTDEIDVIEVMFDDISILLVKPGFEYSKYIHDNIGDVNILIVEAGDKSKNGSLVSKFDPEIFACYGDQKVIDNLIKKLGISKYKTQNKVSAKSSQFGSEDFVLETIVLKSK
ncbi:hypothetical protein GF362_00130 [Candidatus Dojkabacteria bacterium]|nr:hypothetical protein [Candidatus Dojkabacteria bacterium]